MAAALCTGVRSLCARWRPNSSERSVGAEGERRAAAYLRARGLRIVQRNYRCRVGEIDLVAEDDGTLVFVEVKTRHVGGAEVPEAALTRRKRQRLCRAARQFMHAGRLHDRLFRFDIVGVEYDDRNTWRCRHWENVIDYRRGLRRRH